MIDRLNIIIALLVLFLLYYFGVLAFLWQGVLNLLGLSAYILFSETFFTLAGIALISYFGIKYGNRLIDSGALARFYPFRKSASAEGSHSESA